VEEYLIKNTITCLLTTFSVQILSTTYV